MDTNIIIDNLNNINKIYKSPFYIKCLEFLNKYNEWADSSVPVDLVFDLQLFAAEDEGRHHQRPLRPQHFQKTRYHGGGSPLDVPHARQRAVDHHPVPCPKPHGAQPLCNILPVDLFRSHYLLPR